MNILKKYFFIIIILNLSLNVFAQVNNNGRVIYKSYYPDKKQRNRSVIMMVYFNGNESLLANINQVNEAIVKAEETTDGISLTLPYGDSLGGRIYRNIKDSLIITRRPKNSISEAFIVKENWVDINWKIESKTKKIGNYTATKATGSFRGRFYTAWFTYDIPVPFGPWKLHGLPGLILEAEDSEKMMRFYATEIKIPYDTKDIIQLPTAENEITHQEEVYMQDNFDIILAKKMNARLPKGSSFTPTPNNDGRKYRSEKTYEWENETVNEKKD
ncbi:MAG: GLPGLI family protein [Flavobacterium sp.]|nr:GLPGLI family protein [Flavobacterium sp.]